MDMETFISVACSFPPFFYYPSRVLIFKAYYPSRVLIFKAYYPSRVLIYKATTHQGY